MAKTKEKRIMFTDPEGKARWNKFGAICQGKGVSKQSMILHLIDKFLDREHKSALNRRFKTTKSLEV